MLAPKKKKKKVPTCSVIRSNQFDNEQIVPVSREESKDTRYCSKRSRPVIKLDSYRVKSFLFFALPHRHNKSNRSEARSVQDWLSSATAVLKTHLVLGLEETAHRF